MTSIVAEVHLLADHSALLAIPAFAPALMVVGVVIYIARRDRRGGDDEAEHGPHSDRPGSVDEDRGP